MTYNEPLAAFGYWRCKLFVEGHFVVASRRPCHLAGLRENVDNLRATSIVEIPDHANNVVQVEDDDIGKKSDKTSNTWDNAGIEGVDVDGEHRRCECKW